MNEEIRLQGSQSCPSIRHHTHTLLAETTVIRRRNHSHADYCALLGDLRFAQEVSNEAIAGVGDQTPYSSISGPQLYSLS